MEKIYRTVSHQDGVKEFTKAELLHQFKQTGVEKSLHLRDELQGEPKLQGFLGPMYDGEKNGHPVIRYETRQVYDILSI